ncbi:MAG: hypothetical protein R3244_07405 [Thermoanaerobaculia bacterium]|nr:hypothetical protein [Thermoanaerobaculia bacterium]
MEPEQFEPGLPPERQARRHVLDLDLLNVYLVARLGLTRRVGVELEVPYREVRVDATFLDEEGERLAGFESIHHRTETISGLADLQLVGRFRFQVPAAGEEGWILDALGGVTLPTGGTEPDPFELGEEGHEHQHIFFGTGTVDPVAGLEGYRRWGQTQGTGWVRLRVPVDENSHGFRAGTRVSAGFGVQPPFRLAAVDLLAQLEAYHEEASRWGDQAARNSGRTDLILNFGATWAPSPHWSLYAILKLPENLDAEGGQLDLSPSISVGLTHSFHFGGEEDEEGHDH